MNTRQITLRVLTYLFLAVSSFIMFYPVLFTVLGAFTTNERFGETWLLPIPNTLNLNLFVRSFEALSRAYFVTLLRAGFYMAVTVFVGLIGGYIFSKLSFPGRNAVFLMCLSGMVAPAILMVVPQYLQMAWWPLVGGNDWFGRGGHGFIGEWPVLFLYGWVPPFAIFLFKQTFDTLPNEYQEAARLDGAGTLTIIFRVYGPLLKPALAALFIITFLTVWNDYLWPSLTVSGNPAWHPISYQARGGGFANPGVLVRYLMIMWPPALVYLLFQRYFVQGLVSSGVKG